MPAPSPESELAAAKAAIASMGAELARLNAKLEALLRGERGDVRTLIAEAQRAHALLAVGRQAERDAAHALARAIEAARS